MTSGPYTVDLDDDELDGGAARPTVADYPELQTRALEQTFALAVTHGVTVATVPDVLCCRARPVDPLGLCLEPRYDPIGYVAEYCLRPAGHHAGGIPHGWDR